MAHLQVQREPRLRELQSRPERERRGLAAPDASGARRLEPQGPVLRAGTREVPVLAERARVPIRRARGRGARGPEARAASARRLAPLQIMDRPHELSQGEARAVLEAPHQEAQLDLHAAGKSHPPPPPPPSPDPFAKPKPKPIALLGHIALSLLAPDFLPRRIIHIRPALALHSPYTRPTAAFRRLPSSQNQLVSLFPFLLISLMREKRTTVTHPHGTIRTAYNLCKY
jgi:hypothetical protein